MGVLRLVFGAFGRRVALWESSKSPVTPLRVWGPFSSTPSGTPWHDVVSAVLQASFDLLHRHDHATLGLLPEHSSEAGMSDHARHLADGADRPAAASSTPRYRCARGSHEEPPHQDLRSNVRGGSLRSDRLKLVVTGYSVSPMACSVGWHRFLCNNLIINYFPERASHF